LRLRAISIGERAFDLAEQYFGEIPAGAVPAPVQAAVQPNGSSRLFFEDRVELPRVYLAWHSAAMFAEDDAELDLASDLIAHGKTSRLYRSLVYDRQIAADVVAYQHSRELSGVFQIAATAAPGVALRDLEEVILRSVRDVADNGPTADELERARAQADAEFVYRVQTIGGFGGKSDQLNAYNVFQGDPGYFARDRARYESVTPGSIQSAVRRWIGGTPQVTLCVVPRGASDRALDGARPVTVS
jgi:zinc protease